eukprot:scaffold45922_cov63-Attheya_sp.AAC.5
MHQENLLQDLNRELKEIKKQLKAITISSEKKLKSKNNDEKLSAEKKFENAQKEKYSITLDHRQARRISRESSEKRTKEKEDKKRKNSARFN